MLGFNPLSDSPISDIALPVITGTIYATDSNDTADLTAQALVQGDIYTTDGTDFAVISGEDRVDGYIQATDGTDTADFVSTVAISGVIDTTDGEDTADIVGAIEYPTGTIDATDSDDTADIIGETTPTPPEPGIDTHDGFTRDEIKRARELDKKLEKARLKLIEAKKAQKLARKQKISDLVSPPVAKIQQPKVKSVTVVESTEPLKQIIKATQEIKRLEAKQAELERLAQLRVQQAYAEAQLAIIQAKLQAELEDEESILALLL